MTHTTIVDSFDVQGIPALVFAVTDDVYNTDVFKLVVTNAGTIRVEKLLMGSLYDFVYPSELISNGMNLEAIDEMIQSILMRCSKGEATILHIRDSVAYANFLENISDKFNPIKN